MLERIFKLKENHTTPRQELLGGATTFMTMVYILIIIPRMSADAGMDFDAAFSATIISSIIGCLLMGFIANLPIALAPGLGINAFFAYTIVLHMGYTWEMALAAVFIEGLIFIALSLLNIREMIVKAIPNVMRYAISVGIGLFIATIGLVNAGVIVSGGTLATLGKLSDPAIYLTLIATVIIAILLIKRVRGAMLIAIAITTVLGFLVGVVTVPEGFKIISVPHSIEPLFMKMDFSHLLSGDMFTIVFTLIFTDIFDTAGTLITICNQPNMVDEEGHMKSLKHAFLADAIATTVGAVLGSSTVTSYSESSTGVAAGGRTGLTAVVVALLFISALFLSPLFALVPMSAISAVLIVVGLFIITAIRYIDFEDYADSVPAFLTIIIMPLSYSIANGIIFGFLTYIFIRLLLGRYREVSPVMYVLATVFVLKIVMQAI